MTCMPSWSLGELIVSKRNGSQNAMVKANLISIYRHCWYLMLHFKLL